jgi:hypothetical protein
MKKNFKIMAVAAFILVVLASCNQAKKNADPMNSPSHVKIKAVKGKYHFLVNNQLFEIKGVNGGREVALLYKSGGTSFRAGGGANSKSMLDTAYKYHMMVAMNLSLRQELQKFDYNDTAAVARQFIAIKKVVDTYKNHPSVLCWVAGNELNLSPNRGKPVNPKVYDALKDVVDYINKTDPNHPVTTTFAGVSKAAIVVALEHCPDLDFISLQVYGSLDRIPALAKAAGITKPYLITEFGPRGHWEVPATAWGREIEEPSAVKASGLMERIQKGIISDSSGLNLGGYAFLWGQKQERTPTWYGMFIKSGEATAAIDELTKYWTGKYPEIRAPKVDSLKLADKKAVENIYLKPGVKYPAKVYASDPNNFPLTYKWTILKEVIVRSQGGGREIEPDTVHIQVISNANGELMFKSPKDTGEYRLFSYVFNGKNKVGTANVPFYVK